jgi:histidyl-tRNA synthetase
MRDFLPLEKARRDELLGKIRTVYKGHGFQEIETPALEDLARLTSGQGGDNEKLAFRVLKRGAELDEALGSGSPDYLADLGLRYDLTVPLTRYYATNRSSLPTVFKAIQTGPVWRAERPQKGRYRQFVQCDIDIIGEPSHIAEVELLVASLDALASIGLSDASIRVNHRALLSASITALGISDADALSAMITIDKLDKVGVSGVASELASKFGSAVSDLAAAWLSDVGSLSVPAELADLFLAVDAVHPGKLRYDATLVRGMGYYTGSIFEIEHPESGSSIGGGGRYDGMIGRWLGSDVPAVGISIGFERAVDLVSSDVSAGGLVLVLDDSSYLGTALQIQRDLIAAGEIVRIELRPKKLNTLLDSLALQGFSKFAVVDGSVSAVAELNVRSIG